MTRGIRPIILGGDLGAYATARAFHEEYGVRTVVLSGTRIGPTADSNIIDLRVIEDLADTFVPTLQRIIAEKPQATTILLGSVDWWVEELVANRDILQPGIVPYVDLETLDQITNKARFAEICQELGVPHPKTVVVSPGEELPPHIPLPMVVKVADAGSFRDIEFPGKNKVEFFASREELERYLRVVKSTGYTGEFVVQEEIPGGDDSMAAVNALYDADGRAKHFVYGRVLLEEHTPNGLGNSVAQITGSPSDHPAIIGAKKILDHLGWVGFGNFDLKISDDEHLFFELNPRVGRSGYAVTAAGYNVARYYVETFMREVPSSSEPSVTPPAHLFTVVPLRLLQRYAPRWRQEVRTLKREQKVTNPYYYRAEKRPRRWFYVVTAMINQFRKFKRHHPGLGDE